MGTEFIEINGARTHNLKNININIPKNKFVVVTGKSGSGKSTLIIDTLFKYAKKIYLEALSSNNLSLSDDIEVDVNYIKNIQPPIAIEQTKRIYNNPRSTLGTLTSIDGYLRILFSKLGHPVCPVCYGQTNEELFCDKCFCYAEELKPQNFGPTSKEGMCLECNGIGRVMKISKQKIIPDESMSLKKIWDNAKKNTFNIPSNRNIFSQFLELNNLSWETKYMDLTEDLKNKVLYGSDDVFTVQLKKVTNNVKFQGIIEYLEDQYKKTSSVTRRKDIEAYIDNSICSECNGTKLRKESLAVKVEGVNFAEVQAMPLYQLKSFLEKLKSKNIDMMKEVIEALINISNNLCEMSIGYLSINRPVSTLSGGELQRVLISQHIASNISGVMYIFDEPTVGLHDRDTEKIVLMLKKLRDMGNTVIVIEHDETVISEADYIIEIGPDSGENGGELIACGDVNEFFKKSNSLTATCMRKRKVLRDKITNFKSEVSIKNICTNNLKNIAIKFPINGFTCITGVSGSGKSSLVKSIYDSIYDYVYRKVKNETISIKKSDITNIIYLNQNSIRGSSRSNLMTYIGFYDDIRNIFEEQAKKDGTDFTKSDFSINLPGGRCECCKGQGEIEVDMYFLKSEYVTCDKCGGKRFRDDVLAIKYNNMSIYDIFELSAEEALKEFQDSPYANIVNALQYLCDFGLGYLKLGQTTDSLSGGESQRIHLISELIKSKKNKTLYIFDEPSTGLHFLDIVYLIKLFNELIKNGNTVIVIEHNMDLIYNSDYIIDIGPESGDDGGNVVYEGLIKDFINCKDGFTTNCLKNHINKYYK